MNRGSPFPNLTALKVTSSETPNYNCIAWAFEDNTRWWWPQTGSYWPCQKDKSKPLLDLFEELFQTLGWEQNKTEQPEVGLRKIALYCKRDEPTHAARLLENGFWTSKIGSNVDISHALVDLEGGAYGAVRTIFSKPHE